MSSVVCSVLRSKNIQLLVAKAYQTFPPCKECTWHMKTSENQWHIRCYLTFSLVCVVSFMAITSRYKMLDTWQRKLYETVCWSLHQYCHGYRLHSWCHFYRIFHSMIPCGCALYMTFEYNFLNYSRTHYKGPYHSACLAAAHSCFYRTWLSCLSKC